MKFSDIRIKSEDVVYMYRTFKDGNGIPSIESAILAGLLAVTRSVQFGLYRIEKQDSQESSQKVK